MDFPWLLMIVVSILGTVVYLAFMVFLPEWVGISKKSKDQSITAGPVIFDSSKDTASEKDSQKPK